MASVALLVTSEVLEVSMRNVETLVVRTSVEDLDLVL